MTNVEVVPAGAYRAAVTNLDLGTPPPARIYVSGQTYLLQAPRIPIVPILNTLKMVLGWSSSVGAIARNILHLAVPATFVTSDPAALQTLATQVMNAISTAATVPSQISSQWSLNNVTLRDLAGTTAQGTSTSAPLNGTNGAAPFPPGTAVVLSWQVATSYRGGKPRTYLPGVPATAVLAGGSAQLTEVFTSGLYTAATNVLNAINAISVAGGGHPTLGTVSYQLHHAPRPTPIFESFFAVKVHERIDSQRRRNGKESSFPIFPS